MVNFGRNFYLKFRQYLSFRFFVIRTSANRFMFILRTSRVGSELRNTISKVPVEIEAVWYICNFHISHIPLIRHTFTFTATTFAKLAKNSNTYILKFDKFASFLLQTLYSIHTLSWNENVKSIDFSYKKVIW